MAHTVIHILDSDICLYFVLQFDPIQHNVHDTKYGKYLNLKKKSYKLFRLL